MIMTRLTLASLGCILILTGCQSDTDEGGSTNSVDIVANTDAANPDPGTSASVGTLVIIEAVTSASGGGPDTSRGCVATAVPTSRRFGSRGRGSAESGKANRERLRQIRFRLSGLSHSFSHIMLTPQKRLRQNPFRLRGL